STSPTRTLIAFRHLTHLRGWLGRDESLPDLVEQWNAERSRRKAECSPDELVSCVAILWATIRDRFPPSLEDDVDFGEMTAEHVFPHDIHWCATESLDKWQAVRPKLPGMRDYPGYPAYFSVLDDVVAARIAIGGRSLDELIGERKQAPPPPERSDDD